MSSTSASILAFYGHTRGRYACFSNFSPCTFVANGVRYTSSEQCLMHLKALLMGDTATAEQILAATTPAEAKYLGRSITPWDEKKWRIHRLRIMTEALQAKFGQNAELRDLLLGTNDATLVEASPSDRIWGVGLGVNDKRVQDPTQWRGSNLLGESLMAVRNELTQARSTPGN
ncbi:hypothetical protein RI367_003923 [Sorochytrium milnesiophthora]